MVSIYIREKTDTGSWRFRKVREGRGIKTGDLRPPFYIRPFVNGKQVWKTLLAPSFKDAREEAGHAADALEAHSKGLTVAEAEALTNSNRLLIKSAVETYLEQKSGKAKKTVYQYRLALNEFIEAVKIRYMDEITESVLRSYKKFMENEGYAGKTIDTRLNIIYFLLKKTGTVARLPRDEMPTVEEETAVPYTDEELEKMFGVMTPEEKIRYRFFLGTGCRDKEVTFAAWQDINWTKKEYHVRRKEDVGFTPKNHESRTIPIPDSLISELKKREKTKQHDRWIFVNEQGRPDNHFLRKLKKIALRAGVNCGQCKTSITKGRWKRTLREVTCKTDPVCEHIYLHRLRKTCATRWMEHGVPIRTLQFYLGHKNLETTMLYLGVTDSNKLRGNINAAFGD
jgi:integrase/recombinase XerD